MMLAVITFLLWWWACSWLLSLFFFVWIATSKEQAPAGAAVGVLILGYIGGLIITSAAYIAG